MVRFLKGILLVALVGGLPAGCRSDFSVSTTVDPLTTFPRRATYAWDLASSHAPVEPRLEPLQLVETMLEEADAAFARHGYTRVEGDADYTMTYEVELRTILEADQSRALTTVWLFLREPSGGRQVWSGAGSGNLHVGLTDQERHRRLREVMDAMLEDFPPAQRE